MALLIPATASAQSSLQPQLPF